MREPLNTFYYWMNERHRIWHRRFVSKEPKPWTDDTIFQSYRFCNVFRELDTETIWVRENIRDRWPDHKYLWFALCVARQINWSGTLEELDELLVDWDAEAAKAIMDSRKRRGETVYTGAYMITNGGVSCPKIEYTCDYVLQPLWEKREKMTAFFEEQEFDGGSLRESQEFLRKDNLGFGGFMTYEVVTDLRHTRYLCEAHDIFNWANAGPGAIRGLNRLHGRPLKKGLNQTQANQEMRLILEDAKHPATAEEGHFGYWFPVQDLEMRDIEHSLCEFDKYVRVRNGEGRPRQRYKGGI